MALITRLDLPRNLHVAVHRKPTGVAPTVVLLHGIGSSAAMWHKIESKLPKEVGVITVDLLGFGQSPKPSKASYNVRQQARSVAHTLIRLRLNRKAIIIGHSMGSLIAIEIAKRYPLLVRSLILVSPPIYRTAAERLNVLRPEELLKRAYKKLNSVVEKYPKKAIQIASKAANSKFMPGAFSLNDSTLKPYISAMQTSIIDQSAYQDVASLRLPVRMIYGSFDPFVIGSNLRRLSKSSTNISLKRILAFHDVNELYKKPILKAVEDLRRNT